MSGETQKEGTAGDAPAAAKSQRKKAPLLLRIFLDTNQLYTGSASDLLRAALKKLIEDSRSHTDVQIEWLIPEVVRWEREYQMTTAARELMPGLAKLERLLGHNLGINDDILSSRVRDAIDKQIRDLGIKVIPLKADEVDWKQVIVASAFRQAPFEKGDKEKGFRDAVIAECLMQVIQQSPKTPSSCRIALVTGDGLLAEAIEIRTAGATNIRILRSIDELQGLINTLVSNVTEEFVASILQAALVFFFSEQSKEGLWYKEHVGESIRSQFVDKLRELPKGASLRENGTWYIGVPSFVEKSGQKITWRTSIQVEANAFKLESRGPGAISFATQPTLFASGQLSDPASLFVPSGIYSGAGDIPLPGVTITPPLSSGAAISGAGGILGYQSTGGLAQTEKVLVASGRTLFHVTWSVVITATGKLIHPRIELIEWKETVWK